MSPEPFQRVALRHDLDAHGLKAGDVAVLIDRFPFFSVSLTQGTLQLRKQGVPFLRCPHLEELLHQHQTVRIGIVAVPPHQCLEHLEDFPRQHDPLLVRDRSLWGEATGR